ncbi:MAG: bifunctional 2-polyprenyl-6-hydroxyphenol methylase/3-demethylubiquinol 3-O-methyltransferase UbiG [Alphaproteobacteria bacterium]|nr:bifunctional 2-polyprenyl-6-hydroxyphenol methylase/3-demethylubiquinol 3-O-methyltransferase UbiG [Alphaproteobacteria bacterium]
MTKNTANPQVIEHFAKDSSHWWDEDGPFKPLHLMNPTRMEFIVAQLKAAKAKTILDAGCGGGLVCEPLARLKYDVTGLDADAQAIKIAKDHAKLMKLNINYKCELIENHKEKYDAVLALEIVEHIDDWRNFLKFCLNRLNKNGILVLSTLNKTAKSFLFGIVGAEHILGLVPKGTHNWKQFIPPAEIAAFLRENGFELMDLKGITMNPVDNSFALSDRDLSVNYILSAKRS